MKSDKYTDVVKRIMDIILSFIALIVAAPLMFIIIVMIKIDSKGPAFHKTQRLGKNGSSFIKYKFRTMVPNGEIALKKLLDTNPSIKDEYEKKYKIKNDPRITSFGSILRRTSLDELPQILNILKGDMSLVGPRDIIQPELEKHYSHCKEKFLSVKPGLTGLWQVSGRSRLPYEERVKLDLYYIDHRSLKMEMLILLKTVPAVFKGDGAC
jgi:lipopolysaccharide/colanic/teichoic acid biosynthesis glycosyltransferase